jgi:hypothetical protein
MLYLPALPGIGWSKHHHPAFATRVASHISGREVRSGFYADNRYGYAYNLPVYQWELTIDILDSLGTFPGAQSQSLQTLMALYNQCQGGFGTFLYMDPADSFASGAYQGTGNGSQTTFTFQRSLQAYGTPYFSAMPAGAVLDTTTTPAGIAAPAVYAGGAPVSAAYSPLGNTFICAAPPANGALITASFYFAYVCRFSEDNVEFANDMSGIWSVNSLKFESVRTTLVGVPA